ncbi:MAG: hypothetical protein H7276_10750 [Caulobacter sp.]|nr:hypothetical protein [Vitreoscilla sp.]
MSDTPTWGAALGEAISQADPAQVARLGSLGAPAADAATKVADLASAAPSAAEAQAAGGLANAAATGSQDVQRGFLPIQATGIPCVTCASMAGPPPAQSAAAIPSFKSGDFNAWFDSQSAGNVAQMYESPAMCAKIKAGLRGNGGHHEYLMVAEAPKWKQWGVSAQQVQQDFAVPIEKLNGIAGAGDGLAKDWAHSVGLAGSTAEGSKRVHNELQAVIKKSTSLESFKRNMVPWAEKNIKGGYASLPPGFHK